MVAQSAITCRRTTDYGAADTTTAVRLLMALACGPQAPGILAVCKPMPVRCSRARLRVVREEPRPHVAPRANDGTGDGHDGRGQAQGNARRVPRAAPAPAAQLRGHHG